MNDIRGLSSHLPNQPSTCVAAFQASFDSNQHQLCFYLGSYRTRRHVTLIIFILLETHKNPVPRTDAVEVNAAHRASVPASLCKQLSCSHDLNLIVCLFASTWTLYDFFCFVWLFPDKVQHMCGSSSFYTIYHPSDGNWTLTWGIILIFCTRFWV